MRRMESAFGLPARGDGDVPPAPRKVTRVARRVLLGLGHGGEVFLMVGLGFFGLGSILATVFCWGLPTDVAIAFAGKETQGEVLSFELNTSMAVNDAHPTLVRFRYQVDGVSHVDATNTFDEAYIAAAQEGRPVPVEYLPSRPEWGRLRGESRALFGYVGTFTLLFPTIGLGLLVSVAASILRRRAVYRRGQAVKGRFAGCNPGLGRGSPGYLSWEYEVGGRTYRSGLWSKRLDELGLDLSNGAPVPVVYLPSRPGDGLPWLGDGRAR